MSQYRLEVRVKPRPGLLDPQGKAIHHSLNSLGWEGVNDVRVGKAIYIDIDAESAAIVAQKGKAGELYVVGAMLPGNAELLEVHADHIVLRRAGARETLKFPAIGATPVATTFNVTTQLT